MWEIHLYYQHIGGYGVKPYLEKELRKSPDPLKIYIMSSFYTGHCLYNLHLKILINVALNLLKCLYFNVPTTLDEKVHFEVYIRTPSVLLIIIHVMDNCKIDAPNAS